MLSDKTLRMLNDMVKGAGKAHKEGGMAYTYLEAGNLGRDYMPEPQSGTLSDGQRRQFARFVQHSQGVHGVVQLDEKYLARSSAFLTALRSDLQYDEISVVIEGNGLDMGAKFSMARRFDNRYFSLVLEWNAV